MDKPLEINGEIRKRFDEERARRILLFTFPEKYSDAELSDRPDIIALRSDIGVEVTNCSKEEIHEYLDNTTVISGLSADELATLNLKTIDPQKVFAGFVPDSQYLAGFRIWGDTQDFIKTFSKKTEKMNREGFQLFHENNLFIYAGIYEEEPYLDFIDYLKKTAAAEPAWDTQFDYIYIFYEKQLRCINRSGLEISRSEVSKEALKEISSAAFLEIVRMNLEEDYKQ